MMSDPHTNDNLGLKIDVELASEDLRRTLFWYNRTKLILIGIFFLFVLFMGLAGVALMSVSTARSQRPVAALLVGSLPALLPAGLSGLVLLSLVFQIRRQARLTAEASEPTRFSFSNDGMDAVTETTSVHTNWSKYKKAVETKTDFLLFPQDRFFYPIPKHFFRNELEIQVFRRLLSENISGPLKLLAD